MNLKNAQKHFFEEIPILRNEVQVLKSTNIDSIRILSYSKASISNENMNDIEADISFKSNLSGETIIEKKEYEKGDSNEYWSEVQYKNKRKNTIQTNTKNRHGVSTRPPIHNNKRDMISQKPIVGSNSNDLEGDFAGEDPMVFLYVGRCKAQTTAEKVGAYLVKKSPG
ncbi:hypothetical protein JTB14_011368 [Gonioctena quinquepunctata]|nr:hypothetical protein JTB14_011368 [Gonioctena quinquepunctata]